MTIRAIHRAHLEGYFLPHPFAVGFAEAAFHVVYDSLKFALEIAVHAVAFALDHNFFALASVKENVDGFFRQILYRNIKGKIIFFRKSFVIVGGDSAFVIIPAGSVDGAFADGKIFVGKNKVRVHLHENTETGAFFTCAEGVVEREHSWRKFVNCGSVVRASIVLGEEHIFPADYIDDSKTAALLHYGFK